MAKTRASEVAAFLGRELKGAETELDGASAASHPSPRTLVFAAKFKEEYLAALNGAREILVLAAPEYEGRLQASHVLTPTARLDFAKALARFFVERREPRIAPTALIPPSAKIGKNVSIGPYSVLGESVEVGDDTEIRSHVVISDGCRIGRRCLVRSNSVLGEEGFGFEYDADGTPVRVPQLGRVVVGDDVEIGACTTIARGAIDDTVIGDHVKIDDHVFIAHNVTIGRNTLVIACAELSGSVRVGKNCWIAPQASVINGVEIGDDALVGLGAVVQDPVESNAIVTGNPARFIRKRFAK
jgi:UDP-3-O-[3-hydroxymyristoyl] glucosamine N-acyltransferase